MNTNAIGIVKGKYQINSKTLKTPISDAERVKRKDPLQPGISIGCFECGTLGLFVKDAYNMRTGFVTCYHVISGWQGMPVTQPGPGTDGGNFDIDLIGTLERFLPLSLGFDAALVGLNTLRKFNNIQFGTNEDLRTVETIKIDDVLTKSGRTTGITSGKIQGKGAFLIDYPFYGSQVISGYSIAPVNSGKISSEGDSGAIWYDDKAKSAKGLHFATDISTGFALASSLSEIFPLLQVKPL